MLAPPAGLEPATRSLEVICSIQLSYGDVFLTLFSNLCTITSMNTIWDKSVRVRTDKTLGYQYFCDVTHPLSSKGGKVYYHRHVASVSIGRWVTSDEVVHHIDHNKLNNRPGNLVVMSQTEHGQEHYEKSGIYASPRGGVDLVPCQTCKAPTTNKRFCSEPCHRLGHRKVTRPSATQLSEDLASSSWTAVGRKYGVSDNAVRKWAKSYGLL